MDSVQIFHSQDEQKKKGVASKIFIYSLLILTALCVAVLSYYYGNKLSIQFSDTKIQTSPIPTRQFETPEKITPPPSISQKPKITPNNSPISPTPSPPTILKTKILSSVDSLDGFRSSSGGGASNLEIRVGRDSSSVSRGFVGFEISEIPSSAEIQSAVLKIYQVKTSGKPYKSGGNLKLDHLTFGDALDKTDYALPALTTNFAVISESEKAGWKEADITDKLKNDLANARSVSQYRIHFENELTDKDADGDFVYFESEENTLKTGNTPQLVVKYY